MKTRRLRRGRPATIGAALLAVALLPFSAGPIAGPAAGAPSTDTDHARTTTGKVAKAGKAGKFAFRANGYATRITGGQVPADSAPVAYQVLPCTNQVGADKVNNLTEVELPGLGTVSGTRTRVWTTHKKGVVSTWSRHKVASVVLSDSPLGTLSITAVRTTARAYHDADGFHTETSTELGELEFKPPIGPAQTLPLPAPNQPVDIPGFAVITLAHSKTRSNADGAIAFANGLKVELLATDTVVRIAHARAEIAHGVRTGIFHGYSSGVSGKLAADAVSLGRNPNTVMPCPGTDGKVRTKSLVGLDLAGQAVVGAVENKQMAKQNRRRATGYQQSSVASINLGDGALVIDGIVAKARVTRVGGKVTKSSKGTRLGSITVNGERQSLPDTGVLEIPGLASIEPGVVKKTRTGLTVVGLRITLLDGTGGVIDLATAKMRISRPR